ncbi:MAG: Mu transposase C-terminal domain-containing protein [Pyrinomonadaceae bacterium]
MSSSIQIAPGVSVSCRGRRLRIKRILDLETVLAADEATGGLERFFIGDLTPADEMDAATDETEGADTDTEVMSVDKPDWEEANRRYALIEPLLKAARPTREMVEEQARAGGVHPGTIYRWIKAFRTTEHVSVLLPNKRGFKEGSIRLSQEVDAIVRATIEDFYLHKRKRSVSKTCEEVENRCRNAGLDPPHPNTVRNRIKAISEKEKKARREGARAAKQGSEPVRGSFPGADFPLAYIQIDHALLDIIVVDEESRRPVGRPWLTVAIDVFSRMICGFYVSLESPGALSTGLAIAHAILPKEKWLKQHNIETPWSVWGLPRTIHADNAKDFRGDMLKRACQEYGINTNFRLVATPHYGGHIERLIGTVATEIHALPGTTFSNPKARGDYDSEAQAVFTLDELDTWLATFFVEVYHQRLHSTLGMSPTQKYMQGVLGTKEQAGTGLQKRFTDETRLRLDFMPYFERTVQSYGVQIDNVEYYHDVLRPFINSTDPADPKKRNKRKFIFRRDPRNISRLYFYNPVLKRYSAIPYRNLSHPAASIWELRAAKKYLEAEGRRNIDENAIFAALKKLRTLEEKATKETKSIRRSKERRRINTSPAIPLLPPEKGVSSPTENTLSSRTNIKPFDEIEKIG